MKVFRVLILMTLFISSYYAGCAFADTRNDNSNTATTTNDNNLRSRNDNSNTATTTNTQTTNDNNLRSRNDNSNTATTTNTQTTNNNNLSTSTQSDSAITAEIKSKFLKEKLFGNLDISAMSIHVETNNGIVYLTGTADNKNQIDNAIKITKSVKGVLKVENAIEIK